MKKNFNLYGALLIACAVGTGCSSSIPEDDSPEIPEEKPETPPSEDDLVQVVERVMMEGEDILFPDMSSRTNLTLENNKFKFSWAENDQVGVIPQDGSQVFFKVKSGAKTKNAEFDGGSWALKTNTTYAAYFPYSKINTDVSTSEIKFSYLGQKQTGDGSLAHMGAYDLMAAKMVSPVDNNLLFKFKHVNCVCMFRLQLPNADSFSSFTLRCNKAIIAKTANLDFSKAEVVPSFVDLGNQLTMELVDVSTTVSKNEVVLFMMLPEIDFSFDDIMVVMQSITNRTYQGLLTSRRHIVSGCAYSFNVVMKDVTMSSDVDSPSFGDKDVEF